MINLGIYFKKYSTLCTFLGGKSLISIPHTETFFKIALYSSYDRKISYIPGDRL